MIISADQKRCMRNIAAYSNLVDTEEYYMDVADEAAAST